MSRTQEKPRWDLDTDNDLDEIWPQVLQRYEEVTMEKLNSRTTFAEFQIQVEHHIARSSTKSHQNTRKVLNNVGLCLQQFGDIIAQGASIVFGPASQCWNAISFVIQAGRKYSEIFDGFVVLMERSAVFLERLNFYLRQECGRDGSRLPHHLRKPAYGILSDFLEVLASSYSLATSKKERWKTMVGVVLFNSDAGVAASLSRMEQRVQDFTHASIDQILVEVKGLAKYLRASDEERASRESEISKHLQGICDVVEHFNRCTQEMKLTLDGRTTKDQHKEDLVKIARSLALVESGETETWNERHGEICRAHVVNTGQWLEHHDMFRKWTDLNDTKPKILFVKAESGYVKTHVFSHIITHLQKKYKIGSGPDEAYLAYYYCGEGTDESLERFVGSVIYQFAAVDVGYATAVANACGQAGHVRKAHEQWNDLVLRLADHMKGTYFICIDGYSGRGQTDAKGATITAMMQRALAKPDASGIAIRLLVTGNHDALSKLPHKADSIETIVLGPNPSLQMMSQVNGHESDPCLLNAKDVEAVTRARVEEMCSTKPDLKGLLDESKIKLLVEGIRGNYNHLEAKITEIKSCDTEQKVLEVVNNTTDDMATVLRNNLKTLEASLDSTQIRKLNELLVWVASMSPAAGVPVSFLQSVLYYTFRENYLLESEISSTYSILLRVNESGAVMFRSHELIKILRESSAQKDDSVNYDPQNEELSRAEIDLCRRFIRNACDPKDYARFRFDNFFDAMVYKAHLHLGDENAVNFTVFSTYVRVLCEEGADENLTELRSNASVCWYELLKALVDNLDTLEPEGHVLSDIGTKLVDMFYEPEIIDAWFPSENLGSLKDDWLERDELVDALLKFWRHPHVSKGYAKRTQRNEWVRKVISGTVSKYSVLERVARRLAQRYFTHSALSYEEYLLIPYGFVVKQAGEVYDERKIPSSQEVDRFFGWLKPQEIEVEDHVRARRLGWANYQFQRYKEALRGFEEAEKHPSSSWPVILGLIRAHQRLKNHEEALKFIAKFKGFEGHSRDEEDFRETFFVVLLTEGDIHYECQDYEAAAACFQNVLGQNTGDTGFLAEVHTGALMKMFEAWTAGKFYQSMVDYLRSWTQTKNSDRGLAYWFQKIAYHDRIHGQIIIAAKRANAVEDICALYQEAIDYLSLKTQADGYGIYTRPHLQYFQAALRVYANSDQREHAQGIRTWEELIGKAKTFDDDYWWAAFGAVSKLSSSLLDMALAGSSPDVFASNFNRLSALARMKSTFIRSIRQGQKDPRLCLIRLHLVRGESESALMEAQDRFCSIFDNWPEHENDGSLRLRYLNLAQTLAVLDKDSDAIAAWQMVVPEERKEPQMSGAEVQDADPSASVGSHGLQSESSSFTPMEPAEELSRPPDDIPKAYIWGASCNGGACGTDWNSMLVDCYVCKNCLDTQLCSGCYEKLQADELIPMICNKNHKMLYLPPFDQNKRQTVSLDMVIVDGQPVPRSQWLNKIRNEFGMQQEQIDTIKLQKARELKAASCIAMHILRLQKRYKKDRANQPVAPAHRPAQTATV